MPKTTVKWNRKIRRRTSPGRPIIYAFAELLLFAGTGVRAEVVLDGKFGRSGPLTGPNYDIPANVGTTRGNNLFHSLSRFNLASGENATFTGPANIQNILTRVTGGTPSSINGTIRSEIDGANLFLINPSGVVFGPGAALDVRGSFAVSTADYLKLADGARFLAALDADDSHLSSAPVSAFGFLQPKPSGITVQETSLAVSEGKEISVIAGEVLLRDGNLKAPAGQIQVASLAAPTEVPAALAQAAPSGGVIMLEKHATLNTTGEGGGRVLIRGGRLTVDNSSVESNTTGTIPGRGIDIAVSEGVEILNGGQITSISNDALASGGDININAPFIRLDGGGLADEFDQPITQIATSSGNIFSEGTAKTGDIHLRAQQLQILNSARVSADGYGAGDAGHVEINAESVLLDGKIESGKDTIAEISADNLGFQAGKGGSITVRADTIDLLDSANISSWTLGTAPAGIIDIEARTLSLLNGSYIGSPTLGQGQAGDIRIRSEKLRIDGGETGIVAFTLLDEPGASGGNIQIASDLVELVNGGFILTTSFGAGRGGNIELSTKNLHLDNASTINAGGIGAGRAGNINIQSAGPILLENGSSVSTSAPGSSGGNIAMQAGSEFRLFNSEISALAGLNGGNVSLGTPSLLYLLNSIVTAQADSTATGFGNGGNLTLMPSQLVMNNSSLISKSSLGNGGNISILADYFFASDSVVDASAPFGLPGSVQITAPELDLSAIYPRLQVDFFDASTLLRPDCGVRLGRSISSFIVLGRGGVPVAPGGFIQSPAQVPSAPERAE